MISKPKQQQNPRLTATNSTQFCSNPLVPQNISSKQPASFRNQNRSRKKETWRMDDDRSRDGAAPASRCLNALPEPERDTESAQENMEEILHFSGTEQQETILILAVSSCCVSNPLVCGGQNRRSLVEAYQTGVNVVYLSTRYSPEYLLGITRVFDGYHMNLARVSSR